MTEEQRLADNEIYKRMWRILESKEAGNEISEEDEEFFKSNLKKITEYYQKNLYKWKRVSSNYRFYDDVLDPEFDDHIMTVDEWKDSLKLGLYGNYDGTGYWVREGKACRDSEVFHSPQLDATHVVWYNK